jgi:hypothetical protein
MANPDSQITIHMAASDKLDRDIALHLAEVKAHKSGMVELRYDVRGHRSESTKTHLTTYIANASALFKETRHRRHRGRKNRLEQSMECT